MKHALYIIIGVALLLFASCGQQQRAKSVVKDFMEANVTDASKVSYLDFTSLDSTRVIGDSLLTVMRQASTAHFRKDIQYVERPAHALRYIRARFLFDRDTCSATFYLNSELTGVVAFKEN